MRPPLPNNPLLAGQWMLIGMVVIALVDNFVGRMAETVSLWQFFIVRMFMTFPIIYLMSRIGMGSIRPIHLWRVMARGALVAMAMVFYFGSLGFVPISQALAGLFTSPIFVLLISIFLLGKPVGKWRIIAVGVGFVGILVVTGASFASMGLASLLPLAAGLFYAFGVVATRELCAGEATLTMVWSMYVMQGVYAAFAFAGLWMFDPVAPLGADGFLLRGWVRDMSPVIWIIVAQAVGSTIGVFFIVKAYQTAEASYAAIFEYSIFIFGPAFAYLLWGQGVSTSEIIGIVLISLAGIIIAFRSPSA
jgi:drug/metabolite transporter (DMT)-like permease